MKLKQILYIAIFYTIAIGLKYIAVSNPDVFINTNNYFVTLFLGFGPLLGGFVMVYVFKRKILVSLFKPELSKSFGLVLLLILLFTLFDVYNSGQFSFYVPSFVLVSVIYGAIEEYGWRGYLQAELKPLHKFLKYFIIAVLWFLWHLEFSYSLGGFLVLIGGSIGMGYVADQSKSLIYVALFHAFVNLTLTSDLPTISTTQKIVSVAIVSITIILLMRLKKR